MTLDKDFEIRCQQIWAEAWIASLASHPEWTPENRTFLATMLLIDFRRRFSP